MKRVFIHSLAMVGLLALLSSCADMEAELKAKQQALADAAKTALEARNHAPPYWKGDDVSGPPKIEVHLNEQRAYFYKGSKLVGESSVSTGRKGFDTPPGSYRVIQKDKDHVSNLYGDYVDAAGEIVKKNVDVTKDPKPEGAEFRGAPMRFFLRFTKGYGMHAGYVPRYRASHGCIRMPGEMAEHFFDAAEQGTPVIVKE
jgi:lipoprotein-anchoring transpeptidase ErfK/SrfK